MAVSLLAQNILKICNQRERKTSMLPILETNLWSQDNVYKPIEFEVKSTNFEVNKLEQDFHDESNGSVASDIIISTPRTTAASKKIIPSIGDYKKLFIIAQKMAKSPPRN